MRLQNNIVETRLLALKISDAIDNLEFNVTLCYRTTLPTRPLAAYGCMNCHWISLGVVVVSASPRLYEHLQLGDQAKWRYLD